MAEKLTIAIVAYKHDFFEESLTSVLNQTLTDYKLIVLDDSKADMGNKIGGIVEKNAKNKNERKINYIKNEKNLGFSRNFYNAVQICDTEYLWIFHDDDVAFPTLAEKTIAALDANKDAAFASSNYDFIDEYGVVFDNTRAENDRLSGGREIFNRYELFEIKGNGFHIPTPGKIFRTELIKKIDFSMFLSDFLPSDAYIELQLNEVGKAILLQDTLFSYRVHALQESKNQVKMESDYVKHIIPLLKTRITNEEAKKVEDRYQSNVVKEEFKLKRNDVIFSNRIDCINECKRIAAWEKETKLNVNTSMLFDFSKSISILKNHFKTLRAMPEKYIIWGAGGAGIISRDYINHVFPKFRCIGFIDKFKTGVFMELPLYSPDIFSFDKESYIIIGTTQGANDAMSVMEQHGYKLFEDYCFGYGF